MARTKKIEEAPATEEVVTTIEDQVVERSNVVDLWAEENEAEMHVESEWVESTTWHEFPEEDDMAKFWSNPAAACEGMQMKYIGMTPTQYQQYWESIKDAEWPCPEGYVEDRVLHTNVYTHEEKITKIFREAPQEAAEEVIARRIKELKLKVANGTATPEEREELKLLVG